MTASTAKMSNEVYDLRQRQRQRQDASTSPSSASSTTSSLHVDVVGTGATIVSSAPSSSWSPSSSSSLCDGDAPQGDAMVLSLNPSMVDSSVLLTPSSSTSANNIPIRENNWMIELIRSIPTHASSIASTSDISSDDIASVISSCCDDSASYSTLGAADVFGNIGRSLMFASAASMGSSTVRNEDFHNSTSKSASSFGVGGSGMETKWWGRLRTDEDWEAFRFKANEYMNTLVVEETRRLTGNRLESDSFDCKSLDKTRVVKSDQQQQPVTAKHGFLLWWLDGICKSIHATIVRITSSDDSVPSQYVSTLVKEIVDIQQQLERLPPMPPALPKELSLDDLPPESRDMLIQYRDSIDEWRRGVMPHQEDLTARYARCQEKLLSAIIDTEERMFSDDEDRCCDALGAINDDGYIEEVEKASSQWDDLINDATIASRGKCQYVTLSAALVAALTAGAGFFLSMQTKRGSK